MIQQESAFPHVSDELMKALEERFSPMGWPAALAQTPHEGVVRVASFLEGGWHCIQSIRAEYDAQRGETPEPLTTEPLDEDVWKDD